MSIIILPDLPLSTRLACALRLTQRIVMRGPKGRETAVGLRSHLEHNFNCERFGEPCRVDWTGTTGSPSADQDAHPTDWLPRGVCPARYADPALVDLLFEAIGIEDLGGLDRYAGRPVALLPARLVAFYRLALEARDRWVEQQRVAREQLYK
jgi:hypothetical protein